MSRELLIDDEDACNLAVELARLTGESVNTVVATALREEIARERARQKRQERIMVITREIAMSAQCSPELAHFEMPLRAAWEPALAR
jgi:hypothetical protein